MGDAPEPTSSPCSIQRSLEILGDRWTILIMRDAFRGIRRFDDFRRDLGIARPVLADRLKHLVDAGVLERRQYCEQPPRDEYRLTPMGAALSPTLVALMRWGDAVAHRRRPAHHAHPRGLRRTARPGVRVLALQRNLRQWPDRQPTRPPDTPHHTDTQGTR